MDLEQFARLVAQMREAQEKFKGRRLFSELLPARTLEAAVDQQCEKILSEQKDLFDGLSDIPQ